MTAHTNAAGAWINPPSQPSPTRLDSTRPNPAPRHLQTLWSAAKSALPPTTDAKLPRQPRDHAPRAKCLATRLPDSRSLSSEYHQPGSDTAPFRLEPFIWVRTRVQDTHLSLQVKPRPDTQHVVRWTLPPPSPPSVHPGLFFVLVPPFRLPILATAQQGNSPPSVWSIVKAPP